MITQPALANSQNASVTPVRAGAGDLHRIAGGIRSKSHPAVAVQYCAAVGNRQLIERAFHEKVVAIAPNAARTDHQHRVAVGTGIIADTAIDVEHSAAVADRQLVERAVVTHEKGGTIAPDAARAGHQHRVAVGAITITDGAGCIEH